MARFPDCKPRYQSLDSGQISIICKAPGDKSHPSVGGNDQVGYYATWMDNRSGQPEVYVYSLGQESELPLAVGPYNNMYPSISGTVIAWESQVPSKGDPSKKAWSIRTLDMSDDNRSELVSELDSPSAPSISDTYLTWADTFADFGWSVYKKLLFGVETREAIPPARSQPPDREEFSCIPGDGYKQRELEVVRGTVRKEPSSPKAREITSTQPQTAIQWSGRTIATVTGTYTPMT